MNRVHIIGRKNSGKTTLVTELVAEYVRRGLRVGTIKHTHHAHELDTPGKDSHRHRESGSSAVGILSRSMNAVFWPPKGGAEMSAEFRYADFQPFYNDCDIVLVEGDTQTEAPKIEVWRAELGSVPMANSDKSIVAIVSDDKLDCETPCWKRSEVTLLADRILSLSNY